MIESYPVSAQSEKIPTSMSFSREQNLAAVSRSIAQVADHSGDLVDAYLERRETLLLEPSESMTSLRSCREQGLAVRLVRGRRTWMASRDRIDGASFSEALRQVARVRPQAAYSQPTLAEPKWSSAPEASEILRFPGELERQIRSRHVAFDYRLRVVRYRNEIQVVGSQVIPDPEKELFYGVEVKAPWGRFGTLFPELGPSSAQRLAKSLVSLFEARDAAPAEPTRKVVVLGPAATAVLLHEAVAHALEVDVASVRGRPEELLGSRIGSPCLHVLDDPAGAPAGVARTTDDEGVSVLRRWLLRSGHVEQMLADRLWSRSSDHMAAGAGRRAHRHAIPGPRSMHLELLAGECSREELLSDADGGLFFAEAESGRLDPESGRVELVFRGGRRIGPGGLQGAVGPYVLSAQVEELLGAVTAVARERNTGGAGWCAKDGLKLPVWATAAAIRLEGLA